MANEIWVVRAGEKARYADDFRNGSFIAVGFEDFFPGDLKKASDPIPRVSRRHGTAYADRCRSDLG